MWGKISSGWNKLKALEVGSVCSELLVRWWPDPTRAALHRRVSEAAGQPLPLLHGGESQGLTSARL